MKHILIGATLALLLGGCAASTYTWHKAGATAETKASDEAGCRAEAGDLAYQTAYGDVAVPWNWSPWRRPWTGPYPDPAAKASGEQRGYERCMRGRGYDFVRTDAAN